MRKQKGILEKKAEELKDRPKGKSDNDLLSDAVNSIEELKDTSNINGKLFVTMPSIRGYYLNITHGNGSEKKLIAFVYPVLNSAVLNFLVLAAKKDTINGILGITDHVCIVKEYKLRATEGPTKQV